MNETKDKLIHRTLRTWQPRVNGSLSEEDARKIAENMVGYFQVLLEWEAREKESAIIEHDDSLYAKSA